MNKRRLRAAAAEIIIPTCYWWRGAEAHEWIIIPGCAARANDPNACTCNIPESRLERERGKRRAAEDIAQRLRDRLTGEKQERMEARLDIKHWLRVLRDHGIDPSQHDPEGPP